MIAHVFSTSQMRLREQDLQQVQAILQGEQTLWTPLYENAYDTVLYSAMQADTQKLLCLQDYQDIVQDAFALCLTQLDRYQGLSRFSRWVGGYAKNITRNRCTRETTRKKYQGYFEGAARLHMENSDPLRILLRLERKACFRQAFSCLQATDRAILVERILENNKPRTIADKLQLTRKDVLRRYDDASFALRRCFTRCYSYPKKEDYIHRLKTIQRRLYEQSV